MSPVHPALAGFTEPVPFTRDGLRDAPSVPGVHAVMDAGTVLYVGSTRNLRERMRDHLAGDREASVLHEQVGRLLDAAGGPAAARDIEHWLAGCSVSWRAHDDPQALKAELVTALRPRFNRAAEQPRTGVWWVNQGSSYDFERAAWIVFAGSGGAQVAHHVNVARMQVGDVVLHHRRRLVMAIGKTVVSPVPARRPYGAVPERDDGWLTRVEYFPLATPIPVAELPERTTSIGPFTKNGDAKQGYLFPVEAEFAERVRTRFADRWPPGSPWAAAERRYWAFQWDSGVPDPSVLTTALHRAGRVSPVGDGVALATADGVHGLGRAGHASDEVSVRLVIEHHLPQPRPRVDLAEGLSSDDVSPLTADQWRGLVARTPVERNDPLDARWRGIVQWARRFAESIDLGAEERSYKLTIAERIAEAAAKVRSDDPEWVKSLRRAFGPPNNLTPWQAHAKYLDWVATDPTAAREGLLVLWDASVEAGQAVAGFAGRLPEGLLTPGVVVNIASFLAWERGVEQHPVYRPRAFATAYRLTQSSVAADEPPRRRYENAVAFVDAFADACRAGGVTGLRDRLDAQGLLWQVLSGDAPASWTATERDAYRRFLEGGVMDELGQLVEQFKEETGYPEGIRAERDAQREELAAALSPEALDDPDVPALRKLAGPAYGSPGAQPGWNRLLQSDEGTRELADAIRHLLYGPGDITERLDAWIGGDRKMHGVGEAMAVKTLAVRQLERWVPCYVTNGKVGKTRILELLGAEPVTATSAGAAATAANDRIRELVEPYLPDDPWGVQAFTWWLLHRTAVPDASLAHLAESLYLTEDFLERILRLLDDKGQVVFYGPPGTGKTHVARKLADHIARGGGTVEKVQFHPAYAYEDFVEGYRPRLADKQVTYELVDGPLKRVAKEAEKRPDLTHVLLVDELNRAQVAKVLGELLFLLEYRDEQIRLQYSAEPFSLPSNLRLIATMNTADRSIALVDAALRRRFHFVPFFPHLAPVSGLLRRWLADHHPELGWVAEMVDAANELLEDRNVAIGPSHFLRPLLSEELVRLSWESSVMPFLEEHFFGDAEQLERFALDRLRRGAGQGASVASEPDEPPS